MSSVTEIVLSEATSYVAIKPVMTQSSPAEAVRESTAVAAAPAVVSSANSVSTSGEWKRTFDWIAPQTALRLTGSAVWP